MAGRLWTIRNSIRSAVYTAGARDFQGEVPVLNETRASWEELVRFLLKNVVGQCYDPKTKTFRLPVGPQVSYQGKESDALELTLRPFIGLGYLARHSSCPDLEKIYLDVIRQGVDPQSKCFWGSLATQQVLIENSSLLTGILLNPQKFWEPLTAAERANFLDYVASCNRREFVDNNWLWSKVFHQLFIHTLGETQNRAGEIRTVMNRIDDFYTGEGWYRDGLQDAELRYDHYNSWAMHYYGLLFCLLAGPEFDDLKAVLRTRFIAFKKSYLLLFSRDHLPVAWGRSLIYRFGMLSCFGVALENQLLDAREIKTIKALSTQTINRFFGAQILDQHGLLTMGYTQTNKNVLEGYSGAGSPYWALKGFSFLLLEPGHDFWKSGVDSKVNVSQVVHVKSGGFSVQRDSDGHSLVINGGIRSQLYSDKYNRFAFSNVFPLSFDQRCLDNCLTVFDGSKFREFDIVDEVVPVDEGVTTVALRMSSLPGVKAAATVVAVPQGYVVIVKIETAIRLKYRFAGFCGVNSKTVTKVQVLKAGHGELRFHSVSPDNNTLGIQGRIEFFESFLEAGSNELVFASLASLNGKLAELSYQEQDGKVTIKADDFLKTFNR
jgi:hypothetical protein